MKKCYVLLGLLLAVAFLLPQGVFAADVNSTNVTITANTLARIELTEVSNTSVWNLAIGSNNEVVGANLTVKSNIKYGLKVSDLMDNGKAAHSGHMMNWTGGSYNISDYLNNSIKVETNPTIFESLEGFSKTLLSNQPATTNAGKDHAVKLQQVVDYGDPVLGGTSMYRIVLKFTAGNI